VLGLLVVIGAALFAFLVGAVLTLGVALLTQGEAARSGTVDEGAVDEWLISPTGLLATNLFLAAGIPLAMLAVWAGHGWRPRWVSSVRGGLRWSWMARCAAVTALVYVPLAAGFLLLGGTEGSPEPQAALLLLVVLFTTPLQAAGEEYLFRGWMSQALGSLVPRPVVGAVLAAAVSATLFALAHGQQDPWLFLDRFAFGVVASWLVWRTGGLEAAVALHAVNNLVAFVPTILLGQLSDALTVTESSPVATVVDIVQMSVVALLLTRMAGRRGVVRCFEPPLPGSSTVPPGTPYRVATGVWAPASAWAPPRTDPVAEPGRGAAAGPPDRPDTSAPPGAG
jgi:hypothetical protein